MFLLVTIIVAINLSGCENQLLRSAKETLMGTEKRKASKENIQDTLNQTQVGNLEGKPETLQQKIRDFLLSTNINGSVSIIKNNQVIFLEGIGYADQDKQLPNNAYSNYPIASISKLFLATSLMKLQEEHKINIQDPVSKYIPNFPNGRNVKLYNLMSHTSGISNFQWKMNDTSPLKMVQEIEKKHTKFQAGTKWQYLDANYIVLGYILEKVTGTPLHEFIQKNILNVVHMQNTGFMTHENPAPYNTVGYMMKDGHVVQTNNFNIYRLFACGDIYSSPYDLSLFDHALLTGQLLTKESINQMLTPRSRSKYGLGLYYNGTAAYSLGVLGGFRTMHAYFNDNTSVVVFLNQIDNGVHIDNIVFHLYQIVKNSSVHPTPLPKS